MKPTLDITNIQPPAGMTFGCPPDWTYRDVPRCVPEMWKFLLTTIGDGNYKLLTEASYTDKEGNVETMRGQLMISPDGMSNLESHLNKEKS